MLSFKEKPKKIKAFPNPKEGFYLRGALVSRKIFRFLKGVGRVKTIKI
jgi:hypothetical protein